MRLEESDRSRVISQVLDHFAEDPEGAYDFDILLSVVSAQIQGLTSEQEAYNGSVTQLASEADLKREDLVEVCSEIQKALRERRKSKPSSTSPEEEEEDEDPYLKDGKFSKLPFSALINLVHFLDPNEGEFEKVAGVCRALCVSINFNLEYMLLLVNLIKFIVFGPAQEQGEEEEEETDSGGGPSAPEVDCCDKSKSYDCCHESH